MNADGTNHVRLTNNSVVDDHPTWSPDGTKIAFVSERPTGGFTLSFMNAEGTNKTEITPITFAIRFPIWDAWSMSWSPDGNRIVFQETTDPSGFQNDIFIVNIDGRDRHVLINGSGDERQPSWSPDGSSAGSQGALSLTAAVNTDHLCCPVSCAPGLPVVCLT